MKVAVISLVLCGVLAAIGAAVLVATMARPSGADVPAVKAETDVDVLVAVREIQPMSVIDSAAVVSKKVPKSQVPENALLNPVQVVGKVLTTRMVPDQPFTKSCFAREGAGVYLAAAVPPGKRAMSISLTDWSGMAGLLYPGSVVDVLVSFKTLGVESRREQTEMMSTTLLQGMQVLAIGAQSIADDEYQDKQAGAMAQRGQINFRMITLLVDPKQAEILQLATQSGSIALAMRNPLDSGEELRRLTRAREISPSTGATSVVTSIEPDPFTDVPEPAASITPPNEWETTIIRGKKSQIRTFPMPETGDSADSEPAEPDVSTLPPAEPAVSAEPAGAGAGV